MSFLDPFKAKVVNLESPGPITIPTGPFQPSKIVQSLYVFGEDVYAVESGVVAVADLDRLIPDWRDGSWTVWPALGLPGDYRIVHRLAAMTGGEFIAIGDDHQPHPTRPSPKTPD